VSVRLAPRSTRDWCLPGQVLGDGVLPSPQVRLRQQVLRRPAPPMLYTG
jgi:hypothetical protein